MIKTRRAGQCRRYWARKLGTRYRTTLPRRWRVHLLDQLRWLLGRALRLGIDPRSDRWGDRTVQEWIVGADHPLVEAVPQLGEHICVIGVLDQIATFTWIEEEVMERLAGDGGVAQPRSR